MFKPRRVQKKALPARVRTTGREGPRGRRGYYPAREGRRQENSDSADLLPHFAGAGQGQEQSMSCGHSRAGFGPAGRARAHRSSGPTLQAMSQSGIEL